MVCLRHLCLRFAFCPRAEHRFHTAEAAHRRNLRQSSARATRLSVGVADASVHFTSIHFIEATSGTARRPGHNLQYDGAFKSFFWRSLYRDTRAHWLGVFCATSRDRTTVVPLAGSVAWPD